jgi:hypothetical protein
MLAENLLSAFLYFSRSVPFAWDGDAEKRSAHRSLARPTASCIYIIHWGPSEGNRLEKSTEIMSKQYCPVAETIDLMVLLLITTWQSMIFFGNHHNISCKLQSCTKLKVFKTAADLGN